MPLVYQRTFAFALVIVLTSGLLIRLPARQIFALALPLVLSGLGVAAFHSYLVLVGKLECPPGIAELGTAPIQSLAAFTLTAIVILSAVWIERECRIQVLLQSVVFAALATYGSIVANPAPKAATEPTVDWKQLKTCQVPFKG